MTTTATPSHPPPPVPNTLAAAAAPVVSSVVPNSGPTTGGTAVVISGSGFTGVTAVRFGSTAAASYTFVSDTQINAVTPPGAVGSARVIVVTSAGSSTQLVNFTYVAVPVPVLSSIAPVSGPLGGGTVVTLTGTGLGNAGAVHFGAGSASFTPVSDTQITAVAPPGASPGDVGVNVTTPGGTSNNVTFTYVAPPLVTQISPNQGSGVGGNTVTITGVNLAGATDVRFGSVPAASFTVVSPTQITAVAPSLPPGPVTVQVTTVGGTSGTGFYYYAVSPPGLLSLTPDQGPTTGGNTVVITGTALASVTAVRFGTATASFTVLSDTRISAVAPAGTRTADVTVTSPGGTSNPLPYTRLAAPALTALSPANGPASGGTTLTITGSGLSSTTSVHFGAVAAGYTVLSDTQLIAVAPPGSGTVGVTVTTLGGTSGPLSYRYLTPPG